MRHWERNGAVFLWKMGTNRNIQRERWRGRLVHDSVTSSGGLQGVNKLGMPAYANIPSLHQSMLVHKGCKSICSWDRGGKDNIQAVNQLNLATWQPGKSLSPNCCTVLLMLLLQRWLCYLRKEQIWEARNGATVKSLSMFTALCFHVQ